MAHLSPNIAPLTWARNVGLLSGFLQLTHLFYLIENRWYYVCTYDVLKPQKIKHIPFVLHPPSLMSLASILNTNFPGMFTFEYSSTFTISLVREALTV